MKWITLADMRSMNMTQATTVIWGKNEDGDRFAVVVFVGGGSAHIDDLEAIEQLEGWMIDNSEVLE